jgi:hypothetical protein
MPDSALDDTDEAADLARIALKAAWRAKAASQQKGRQVPAARMPQTTK